MFWPIGGIDAIRPEATDFDDNPADPNEVRPQPELPPQLSLFDWLAAPPAPANRSDFAALTDPASAPPETCAFVDVFETDAPIRLADDTLATEALTVEFSGAEPPEPCEEFDKPDTTPV